MKRIIKEIVPYIIIIILVLLLRTFIITPVQVVGTSMDPTLKESEVLLLNKIGYKLVKVKRNDIVVIDMYSKEPLIKRVIGLPGEHIKYESGKLYINGKESKDKYASITSDFDIKELGHDTIPDGYYFVVGDNRTISRDSRKIGLIPKKDIDGSVALRIWPLNKLKTF